MQAVFGVGLDLLRQENDVPKLGTQTPTCLFTVRMFYRNVQFSAAGTNMFSVQTNEQASN